MIVKTPYGTVYGIADLEDAQRILAAAAAEAEHEGCSECRGELSLADCTALAARKVA